MTHTQLVARMTWLARLGWAARCPVRKRDYVARVRLLAFHLRRLEASR